MEVIKNKKKVPPKQIYPLIPKDMSMSQIRKEVEQMFKYVERKLEVVSKHQRKLNKRKKIMSKVSLAIHGVSGVSTIATPIITTQTLGIGGFAVIPVTVVSLVCSGIIEGLKYKLSKKIKILNVTKIRLEWLIMTLEQYHKDATSDGIILQEERDKIADLIRKIEITYKGFVKSMQIADDKDVEDLIAV